MAVFTKGIVPWNSLDDNTRLPLTSELEGGYPCGQADQQLFNFTAGYSWGQVHNVILSAGLAIDRTDLTQLTEAVRILIANTVPVGSEIMWSNNTIPNGWFEQDGSTFNATTYPKLAAHLGGNTLPDMRGEFARGWDHGRGVDPGRALKSSQAGTVVPVEENTPGAYTPVTAKYASNMNYDPTDSVTRTLIVGAEGGPFTDVSGAYVRPVRPRNIAKIWLIKHD